MDMSELFRKNITDEERSLLSSREITKSTADKIREDESGLSDEKKNKFIAVINELVSKVRQYNKIVNIHGNMSHDMHSRNMMTGQVSRSGVQRFLSWHRAYLLEFEALLQSVDASVTIPYWNWTKTEIFPSWLDRLLPEGLVDLEGTQIPVKRTISVNDSLPNPAETKVGITDNTTFTDFTLFLEGARPYGAHNQVHNYVGGTMGTMYSPADPIFWMHHAECDRLWHIWQLAHAEEHASLIGNKAVMDPWQYRYKDLVDISALGYSYESVEIG